MRQVKHPQSRTLHTWTGSYCGARVPCLVKQEQTPNPRVIPQERAQQRTAEQSVDVPVPMKQEEVVHAPKAVQQDRHQRGHLGHLADADVPRGRDETIRVPRAKDSLDANASSTDDAMQAAAPMAPASAVTAMKPVQYAAPVPTMTMMDPAQYAAPTANTAMTTILCY